MTSDTMVFCDSPSEATEAARAKKRPKSNLTQVAASNQRPSGILPTWKAPERPGPKHSASAVSIPLPMEVATAVVPGLGHRTINQVRHALLVQLPHK